MTSATTDPDDLDAILDDALEAFDASPARAPPRSTGGDDDVETSRAPATETVAITTPTTTPLTAEEDASAPGIDGGDDDGSRALEDALRALGELGLGGDASTSSGNDPVSEADMKLVEEFVTSLGESLSGLGVPGTSTGQTSATGNNDMPRNEADVAAAATRPEVERLVESIVGHLLSEDVLKTPMAQMKRAYAEWLPANKESLSKEDVTRFSRQRELVDEICEKYDTHAPSSEIMELLSQMQETGAPPSEVMRQLSSDGAVDSLLGQLGCGQDNRQ